MKKYVMIAKVLFKAQLSWRFDVAFDLLITGTKLLFAYIVWGAIFSGRNTVSGFTLETMLTYYLISSFLTQLDKSKVVSGEVSKRIRNGTFSKYMVIPVGAEGYFLAQTFGASAFYLIFNLFASAFWIFLFHIRLAVTSEPFVILEAVLLVLMGLTFMAQLNFFIGILAFYFQDIGLFLMIKENILAFITGAVIPLALLPTWVVSALKAFPFYYVTYLPAMLLIGRNSGEISSGFLTLCLWMIGFIILNRIGYGILRRKYDGVGI